MLEQPALRLQTWTWIEPRRNSADEFSGWIRRIDVEKTGLELGCVRKIPKLSIFNIAPIRLEVCETEDAALLMSLEQGWFSFGRWCVLDAERLQVGSVVGPHLLDEQGSYFAAVSNESAAAKRVHRKDGAVLSRLEIAKDGALIVRFAADLEANPFLRMVLLGACILQQPCPPRSR
jgi:hypothetical protein